MEKEYAMRDTLRLELVRFARCGKAVSGRLYIHGAHVCDTLENADACLSVGEHEIADPRHWIVASNGPYRLSAGQIAVGECRHLGFLVHCSDTCDSLQARLRMARRRRKHIVVVIRGGEKSYSCC